MVTSADPDRSQVGFLQQQRVGRQETYGRFGQLGMLGMLDGWNSEFSDIGQDIVVFFGVFLVKTVN